LKRLHQQQKQIGSDYQYKRNNDASDAAWSHRLASPCSRKVKEFRCESMPTVRSPRLAAQ
jgi:hypothetical protein